MRGCLDSPNETIRIIHKAIREERDYSKGMARPRSKSPKEKDTRRQPNL